MLVHLHVSVRQVLKVVSTDTLVGVRCEHGPAVTQTPQALHPDSFPRVQQISIQVLRISKKNTKHGRPLMKISQCYCSWSYIFIYSFKSLSMTNTLTWHWNTHLIMFISFQYLYPRTRNRHWHWHSWCLWFTKSVATETVCCAVSDTHTLVKLASLTSCDKAFTIWIPSHAGQAVFMRLTHLCP